MTLALVVLVAVGGYLFLQASSGPVRVYVAAHDLPAFHQIVELDVRQANVLDGQVPEDAVRSRDALIGRYTLESLRQDKPYRRSALGPLLKPDALDELATEASPVSTLGGRLARGDRVDVLLSPTDAEASSGRLAGVLVVDIAADSVVLGVTSKNAQTLLRTQGTSRISLLRVPVDSSGGYALRLRNSRTTGTSRWTASS